MNLRLTGRGVPRAIAIATGVLVVYQWAVARPLWLDEQMIAINIRDRTFAGLAGHLWLEQSAPYGWLVLERMVLLSFGTDERALRLFPLLFGLATIATALWIGHRWLRPFATTVLVLLCGIGQWITYSYVELKQYSADACFGLLLPALAVWAVETDRVLVWWIVAALAQLVANGALFVTPACAAVLVLVTMRRRGLAGAVRAAVPGLLWAALFAVNYMVVLRPAQTSGFLQRYWQSQFPPVGAGVVGTVSWIASRLVPFAIKPGGTSMGVLLWPAAVAGFVLAAGRLRVLALTFVTVPLSAFLLTGVHLLPFFERLVLWAVPALYVGVALASEAGQTYVRRDRDVRQTYVGRDCDVRRTYVRRTTTGVLLMTTAVVIGADVTWTGLDDLRARPRATNHRLDDRSAVRWLAARAQPGDIWVTTHLALPAIWWYAPQVDTTAVPAGTSSTIVEVGYRDPGECHADELGRTLGRSRRALVFFGFRFDDVPSTFDDLLLHALADLGQMTAYRGFQDVSRVAIFDLRLASRHDRLEPRFGCVGAQQARGW